MTQVTKSADEGGISGGVGSGAGGGIVLPLTTNIAAISA